MRARGDQIEGLASRIQRGCPDLELSRTLAKNYVEEIEQRVRAEIGRDSERLDWLLSRMHYGIPGFDPKVSGRDPSARKADLIRAIDAAREVGND